MEHSDKLPPSVETAIAEALSGAAPNGPLRLVAQYNHNGVSGYALVDDGGVIWCFPTPLDAFDCIDVVSRVTIPPKPEE